MTTERLAQLLIEGSETADVAEDKPKVDKKISVFMNRLLLRIFSVPALMSFLADVSIVPDDQQKDGSCTIELDFLKLPEEVHAEVLRLCASPSTPKMTRYVKDGSAHTGISMLVKPNDFGGEEYEYAL